MSNVFRDRRTVQISIRLPPNPIFGILHVTTSIIAERTSREPAIVVVAVHQDAVLELLDVAQTNGSICDGAGAADDWRRIPIRTAIIPMTTSSSTRVNPRPPRFRPMLEADRFAINAP
jgi:hypothetical protein